MPPIMGAGAFIMAEIIGVQYAQIAEAAILPAVAYFLAVFILVHMIAKKKGLGKDSGVHYEGKPILPRVYRLLPIVVLVVMIIMGYSLPRSAIYCTIFSIIIAAISPETRMGPRKLLQTLMDGVRQAANIAIPTAACGIMIGIVVNSGVAVKIAKLIGTSGEGSLFIALLIAALGCLLLGMALPTVAAYLIAVTLFASAIQGLGISALVTNMFIFYFGVVAQITPPVCLASFTAAGIAGASAWKTGWKAFSFAITAFIVPFAFVYRPAILLEGTMVEIIIAYCIVIAATYLLACGIAGYLFRPLKMWERIACYVVAFIFILPSSMSDIIGIAGCVLIMAYCFMTGKKNANKAQACLISGPSENLLHKPQFGEAPASGTPGGGGFFVLFGAGRKEKRAWLCARAPCRKARKKALALYRCDLAMSEERSRFELRSLAARPPDMKKLPSGGRGAEKPISIVVAVELEHGGERLAGQGDAAELAHLLFALFLLFQQLFLAGDVAAVALGQHILAHGLDRLAGDDLAADGRLNGDLEEVARDVVPQLLADAAALGVGVVAEDDHGQSVHRVSVEQESSLTRSLSRYSLNS